MSLSRLLETYKSGQEVRFSVPLGPDEFEVWVFKTFDSSGDWEKWERELIEAAHKHLNVSPEHREQTEKAGKAYPKDQECFRHAFLAHKLCTGIENVKGDAVEPQKKYALSQWVKLANETLLVKEAFDAINLATDTTQGKLLQYVYDEAKKKPVETDAGEPS